MKNRIQISAGAFLTLAVLLMLLPIQWVTALFVAAAVHEACHLGAIRLLGADLRQIRVGMRGAVIETGYLSPGRELICTMAGPCGSAALVLLAPWFPRLAICGFVHCFYNLLPIYPMDGGRIFRIVLHFLMRKEAAERFWRCSQLLLRIALIVLVIWLSRHVGALVLILSVLLHGNGYEEKSLANRAFWRYNRRSTVKGVDI